VDEGKIAAGECGAFPLAGRPPAREIDWELSQGPWERWRKTSPFADAALFRLWAGAAPRSCVTDVKQFFVASRTGAEMALQQGLGARQQCIDSNRPRGA